MKTYYLTRGSITSPGSLCSGIPGDPAFYAPVNTEEIRWVKVEELERLLEAETANERARADKLQACVDELERKMMSARGALDDLALQGVRSRNSPEEYRRRVGNIASFLGRSLAATPPATQQSGDGLTQDDCERLGSIASLVERLFPGVTDVNDDVLYLRQLASRASGGGGPEDTGYDPDSDFAEAEERGDFAGHEEAERGA